MREIFETHPNAVLCCLMKKFRCKLQIPCGFTSFFLQPFQSARNNVDWPQHRSNLSRCSQHNADELIRVLDKVLSRQSSSLKLFDTSIPLRYDHVIIIHEQEYWIYVCFQPECVERWMESIPSDEREWWKKRKRNSKLIQQMLITALNFEHIFFFLSGIGLGVKRMLMDIVIESDLVYRPDLFVRICISAFFWRL